MSKRFLTVAGAVALAGLVAVGFVFYWADTNDSTRVTDEDVARMARQLGYSAAPPPAKAVRLDPAQRVRLAIGNLGLADQQNAQVSDLVLVQLDHERGLELIERQELEKALDEVDRTLSGLVRAKDAIQVGALLRADWFLLGTRAVIGGTNSIVVRVVDARSGVFRDSTVLPITDTSSLARGLATFVRECRQRASDGSSPAFLALGSFQDVGVNDRLAAFPEQIRSYLMAAYQTGPITLLERDAVSTLLREIQLDLAGLTDTQGSNVAVMQTAYWLVGGSFQSYETSGYEVELVLEVSRMFGKRSQFTFRERPGEGLMRKIKEAVDTAIARDSNPVVLSRNSEARAQLSFGKELAALGDYWSGLAVPYSHLTDQAASRQERNIREAIRAFETVLLLEPTNREARVYLAACLRAGFLQETEKALDLYRQILDENITDKWSRITRNATISTLRFTDPDTRRTWFENAAANTPNQETAAFYLEQAREAERTAILRNGDDPRAVEVAESKLFETLRNAREIWNAKSGTSSADLGIWEFVRPFGTNRAAAAESLNALLPRLRSEFPDLDPHIVLHVLALQTETNTPVLTEFLKAMEHCAENPRQVLHVDRFWSAAGYEVYPWFIDHWLLDHAIELMKQIRRASEQGFASAFGNDEKMMLAFACMGAKRWTEAIEIFQTCSNQPVRMIRKGPWGRGTTVILPSREIAFCREKLGLPAIVDPLQFTFETNRMCMHTRSAFESAAFAADTAGLWIAIDGNLIQIDFDFRTNRVVRLPARAWASATAVKVDPSHVWIATSGGGLVRFDIKSGNSRVFSQSDGLLMDEILALALTDQRLWIGYGGNFGSGDGGLGNLDLSTGRFESFMPAITASESSGVSRSKAGAVAATEGSTIWALMKDPSVGLVRRLNGVWESIPPAHPDGRIMAFAVDANYLVQGLSVEQSEIKVRLGNRTGTNTLVVSSSELDKLTLTLRTNGSGDVILSRKSSTPIGLLAWQPRSGGTMQFLRDSQGLPHAPNTMTLDGKYLWVGGLGYIAVVDLADKKVLRVCYVSAEEVDSIQVAGAYLWAKFAGHLHRAPLNRVLSN